MMSQAALTRPRPVSEQVLCPPLQWGRRRKRPAGWSSPVASWPHLAGGAGRGGGACYVALLLVVSPLMEEPIAIQSLPLHAPGQRHVRRHQTAQAAGVLGLNE